MEAVLALEQLKAQIGLLLTEMNNQPEDLHELYEEIHQKLNELRATGMSLPQDLLDLEARLLSEFPVSRQRKRKDAPESKG
jgi:hypothetical protein